MSAPLHPVIARLVTPTPIPPGTPIDLTPRPGDGDATAYVPSVELVAEARRALAAGRAA